MTSPYHSKPLNERYRLLTTSDSPRLIVSKVIWRRILSPHTLLTMGKDLLANDITGVPQVRRWSWITRLSLASLTGVIITSAVFLLSVANKAPRELNYVLMPGAIIALAVGFVTHYGEHYYAATFLKRRQSSRNLISKPVSFLGKTPRPEPSTRPHPAGARQLSSDWGEQRSNREPQTLAACGLLRVLHSKRLAQ